MTTPHRSRRSILGTPTPGRVQQAFKSPFRSPLPNSTVTSPILNDNGPAAPLGLITETHSKSVQLEVTPNEISSGSTPVNENSSSGITSGKSTCFQLKSNVKDTKFNTPRTSLKRRYPCDNGDRGGAKPFRTPFKNPLLKSDNSPGPSCRQSPVFKKIGSITESSSEISTPKRPSFSRSNTRCSILKKSSNSDNLQELEQLLQQEKDLDKEIFELELEGYDIKELQTHIEKLHRYNDLKDAAQMVMGQLAVMENDSVKNMHERYEVANLD